MAFQVRDGFDCDLGSVYFRLALCCGAGYDEWGIHSSKTNANCTAFHKSLIPVKSKDGPWVNLGHMRWSVALKMTTSVVTSSSMV